jgi:hypothetical protein
VPALRRSVIPRGASGSARVPDIRDIVGRTSWTEAACRDESDMQTFFPDERFRDRDPSASLLLPLLVCQTCPIRRRCLAESLTSWGYQHAIDGQILVTGNAGVWGGTLEVDRHRVSHLAVSEAVELLESTLGERTRGQ